jgi:RNA polymerase sigma factor (sigma-70 family)
VVVSESLEEWFRREILPHEAALVRFLARKWIRAADVQDIRHDIYVRVLEAAERGRPASPKSFLFTVARNLLVDRARRDRIVAIDLLEDLDVLNVLIDEVSPERRASGRQQLQRLSALFDRLPPRCREVLWMRRIEDLPQKEISARLGIAEGTVEKHLVRSIRMLADAMYGDSGRGDRHEASEAPAEQQAETKAEPTAGSKDGD